jgi:N12 class adenine-specific DNA methylase
VQNSNSWQNYLEFASGIYKYGFDNSILIYSQRPDATMVADLQTWNKKVGRWVNRGAKSIAVFDTAAPKLQLRYLFDVSDTNGTPDTYPRLWQLTGENSVPLLEKLNDKYNLRCDSIDEFAATHTINRMADIESVYYEGFRKNMAGSGLADLDDETLTVKINVLLLQSVQYMVFCRCGFDTEIFNDSFDEISDFNNKHLLYHLGNGVCAMSQEILGEFASTLNLIIKEQKEAWIQQKKDDKQKIDTPPTPTKNKIIENIQKQAQPFHEPIISSEQISLFQDEITDNEDDENELELEIINTVIMRGNLIAGGKEAINTFFKENSSDKERIKYLKQAYGICGSTLVLPDGRGSWSADGHGIKYTAQNYGFDFEGLLTWTKVSKLIAELVDKDLYCEPTEDNSVKNKPETIDDFPYFKYNYGDFISLNGKTYEILENMPDVGKIRIGDVKNNIALHKYVSTEEVPWQELEKGEFAEQPENLLPNPVVDETEYIENIEVSPDSEILNADEIINTPNEEIEHYYEIAEPEPTMPNIPRIDYHYTIDDEIGVGGPKTKFRANIEAIKMLSSIEKENRLATFEEQKVLCRYVGWGGLADAFNPESSAWANEYKELKDLLSAEEYESARASTLSAHYTPPKVIQSIYDALESFGFKGGNILEPAMGTGNFFAVMPNEIRENSKLYGVELDEVSGRIAKQLHQSANIKVQGYETTDFPDNFFDVAIGNVPFGDFKLHDPQYNKHNFLIHDYFLAKTLDKVRPGGVIAFITSKGTLDKENSYLRKHISAKTDLIGAIRLPNNTFRQIANTEVTSDIIFLQKRERIISEIPYWTEIGETEDGIPVNSYFAQNPYMMLGKMEYDNRFGEKSQTLLKPIENSDLQEELSAAIKVLDAVIPDYEHEDDASAETIPADPNVRNFTFVFAHDALYYRENSFMRKMDYTGKKLERIKGMCEIRDITRKLIDAQSYGLPDEAIKLQQKLLATAYDSYIKKNGFLSEQANNRVFRDDSDYPLLCSLEVYDEETKAYSKADMFTKQTIRPKVPITSVDTATDALKVSLCEKGRVDLKYMCGLYEVSYDEIFNQLRGQIFINPEKLTYNMPSNMSISDFFNTYGDELHCMEIADEYLSGDVRRKLHIARLYAEQNAELFTDNVTMLQEVQPPMLDASEIDVKIGVTWIDIEDYKEFMYETFHTPYWAQNGSRGVDIEYNRFTNAFSIRNKGQDNYSVIVTESFGTKRMNAYEILEETLNLRSATVYDRHEDNEGKVTYKPNQNESVLAREKQGLIKDAFKEWIFAEPNRRKKYVDLYNEKFNNIRLRKYDGSHLEFDGMSPDIELRSHQKDAIARALYSSTNALLDHKVGAGKTFVMVASCMELKRLQLAQKSIFVVPNHLTGQTGSEFLRLYPSAKILVATKRDFETQNRLKFVSKIATGDWDAVIIGHSQFEKISMSKERQIMLLDRQVNDILGTIATLRHEKGDGFTIKQMEKMRANLEAQIKELADDSKKDDLITFESLGIDYMFVDEAHYYKNCAVFSKMRNVAGITQTKAKKATDMLMKCQYINEINNGQGLMFATGTPLSNTMTEMFVMQRYLDYKELEERGLLHFDAWAAQFGEVVSSLELAPEGTGYRYRNRFAKFTNLPELLTMYHNFADVVTDEMLDIPIPKIRGGKCDIVVCNPSDFVLLQMMEYVVRANNIRSGIVKSWEDNMLKITNEARLLATDPRLIDSDEENTPNSKVSKCADKVFYEYTNCNDIKGTQIIFCDIGTPNGKKKFNVYDALKQELIVRGMPENEICFIHDAKNDKQREDMFSKMRSGEMRIIVGSTSKMGTGTNIQNRLVALHHMDCPYRPADIEQREGRALRQGNMNDEVAIYRYVTQNTFDSYMWQLVENKQRFISQIKSGNMIQRSCEDIDETVLSFAEVKAIATGDERIKEKMDLDLEISRMQLLKANYDNQRYSLQDKFTFTYPKAIAEGEQFLECLLKDREVYNTNQTEEFSITVDGKIYDNREEAGKRIMLLAKAMKADEAQKSIGVFRGFELQIKKEKTYSGLQFSLVLHGNAKYTADLSDSPSGNTTKLDNLLKGIGSSIEKTEDKIDAIRKDCEAAKAEYKKPFTYADSLKGKLARQAELDKELDLSKKDDIVAEDNDNLEEKKSIDKEDIKTNLSEIDEVTQTEPSHSEKKEPNTQNTQIKSAVDSLPYSQLEKKNFKFIRYMFPEIFSGEYDYMKFKAEHHDDMYIERLYGNTYALCLFYIKEGDLMREPEYTFSLDKENGAVRILDWTLSSMGMYHEVYDAENPERYKPDLKKDLDASFNSTLENIVDINYVAYRMKNDEKGIDITIHETAMENEELEL